MGAWGNHVVSPKNVFAYFLRQKVWAGRGLSDMLYLFWRDCTSVLLLFDIDTDIDFFSSSLNFSKTKKESETACFFLFVAFAANTFSYRTI